MGRRRANVEDNFGTGDYRLERSSGTDRLSFFFSRTLHVIFSLKQILSKTFIIGLYDLTNTSRQEETKYAKV